MLIASYGCAFGHVLLPLLVAGQPWPKYQPTGGPYLGIDYDIYYRLQATVLKLLLGHSDYATDTELAANNCERGLAIGAILRIHTVDDCLGRAAGKLQLSNENESLMVVCAKKANLVMACYLNLKWCIDRLHYSAHRPRNKVQVAYDWLKRHRNDLSVGMASTLADEDISEYGIASIFTLSTQKTSRTWRTVGIWRNASVLLYDQLDRRLAKYNYHQTKYIKAFSSTCVARRDATSLSLLLHNLQVRPFKSCYP